jgi:succinate dehydrogenase / fumarate reductase, cytochrome b subunit
MTRARPLSPHLQIYKPQITSILSITHRLTGFGLMFGIVFLVGFIYALSCGAFAYRQYLEILQWPFVVFMKYAMILALSFHFYNGIRHLMWDIGCGLSIQALTISGWLVLALTVFSTILIGATL